MTGTALWLNMKIETSRHTICHAAKKACTSHREYIDRKKEKYARVKKLFKTAFSHVHSSMAPSPKHIILHYSCLPGRVGHTANLNNNSHLQDMGVHNFVLISLFFSYTVQELWGL